jgi:hypothetical protein
MGVLKRLGIESQSKLAFIPYKKNKKFASVFYVLITNIIRFSLFTLKIINLFGWILY